MDQLDIWATKMRENPTRAEYRLMLALVKATTKYPAFGPAGHFLCQHVIQCKILDFYFPKISLCIEVDGGYHNDEEQKKKDKTRDMLLANYGIKTVRITNQEVLQAPNKAARRLLCEALGVPNPARGPNRINLKHVKQKFPPGCKRKRRKKYSIIKNSKGGRWIQYDEFIKSR